MKRGWEVEYKDGQVINESQRDWYKLPNKQNIVRLTLKWDGKRWDIRDKEAYIQQKRAMSAPSAEPREGFVIARYIGYYEGNKKILYKVDEFTGQMTLEVREG